MKPLLIIKTGKTTQKIRESHGDFENMILNASGISPADALILSVFEGALLPDPETICGAVITGSGAMVTDREPWSVYTEIWARKAHAAGLPILGICFGHQLLAQAFGGTVGYHPLGVEVGTVSITLSPAGREDALLNIMDNSFSGHVIHYQTVLELPPDAVLLASNTFEPHHAFRLGATTWGVQFHPEFTEGIILAYIDSEVQGFNKSPEALEQIRSSVHAHSDGVSLMQQFLKLVYANDPSRTHQNP